MCHLETIAATLPYTYDIVNLEVGKAYRYYNR